jgi:hypothetical protein
MVHALHINYKKFLLKKISFNCLFLIDNFLKKNIALDKKKCNYPKKRGYL